MSTLSHKLALDFHVLLYIFYILINGPVFSHGNTSVIDTKVLNVGEELWREALSLQVGSRFYQLQGLKSHTWYEVKISYPASIPAAFSLQLKKDKSEMGLYANRRLLNTEKIIFKTDNLELKNQSQIYVLLTVEPEGFVAIPNVPERQFILFNIVCDELLLGIPYQAWWVVVMVVLCLILALIIPAYLPPDWLAKNQRLWSFNLNAPKDS